MFICHILGRQDFEITIFFGRLRKNRHTIRNWIVMGCVHYSNIHILKESMLIGIDLGITFVALKRYFNYSTMQLSDGGYGNITIIEICNRRYSNETNNKQQQFSQPTSLDIPTVVNPPLPPIYLAVVDLFSITKLQCTWNIWDRKLDL